MADIKPSKNRVRASVVILNAALCSVIFYLQGSGRRKKHGGKKELVTKARHSLVSIGNTRLILLVELFSRTCTISPFLWEPLELREI